MLANQLGRPVIDQTGLTARYDLTLEFTPEPGAHGSGAHDDGRTRRWRPRRGRRRRRPRI